MPEEILIAFCLVLIFEGILPLASPRMFRQYIKRVEDMDDNGLRKLGAASMIIGTFAISFFL